MGSWSERICPACGRSDATNVGPGALCAHDGRVLVDVELAAVAADDPILGRVINDQYAVYDQQGTPAFAGSGRCSTGTPTSR